VIRRAALSVQACVPADWSDGQVVSFVEGENPCGTERGWAVRREEPERVACASRSGFVHVVLDA
jgi:hypothetical protein